jgi:hypothetical protein|tara:strand:- start:1157 stop:1744 length:588 start_codon:yes stop_codon:yes gene_type:complete
MIKQNIFIINYSLLYEILEEIKEHLPFKIIKYENLNEFIKIDYPDIKNDLLIIESKKKLLINKNLSEINFFDLKDIPMSLNKLIELLNINLIKLKFAHKSKICIKGYDLNLNSKFFSKGKLNLKLTEKEINIILYLNDSKLTHDVRDLQKNIWGYVPNMETHTVETHIYRLRKKISNKFKDEKFILSHKSGYIIE